MKNNKIEIARFLSEKINKLSNLLEIDDKTKKEVQKILNENRIYNEIIDYTPINPSKFLEFTSLSLNTEYQDTLAKTLFQGKIKYIHHYTTWQNAFSIINESKLKIGCIVGMNDKSEINYFKNFYNKNFINTEHGNTVNAVNDRYILSGTSLEDDLNSWRLYGNECMGACLTFSINQNYTSKNDFLIGKVIYGPELPGSLYEIKTELRNKFKVVLFINTFFLWKYFVKHEDYRNEKEIRLYYINNGKKGKKIKPTYFLNSYSLITSSIEFDLKDKNFPLLLKKITLGPTLSEKENNKTQLEYLLRKNKISNVEVKPSKIEHYRNR